MSNASVAISPASPLGLIYLSENEDDPLPDKSLRATGKLGLYAVGGHDERTVRETLERFDLFDAWAALQAHEADAGDGC